MTSNKLLKKDYAPWNTTVMCRFSWNLEL